MATRRMRKACDYCRKAKIRCEKRDNAASCEACLLKGVACIITRIGAITSSSDGHSHNVSNRINSALLAHTLDIRPDGPAVSLASRQWSQRFLFDFLFGGGSSLDISTDDHGLPCPEFALDSDCNDILCHLAEPQLAQIGADMSLHPNGSFHAFISFPREEEILDILTVFSHHTAATFPLFREETIDWVIQQRYSDAELMHDAPSWASMNVALAIGYKFHSLMHPELPESSIRSNAYLKNALAAVPRLILLPPTMLSLQALLGIVFLARSSLDLPQTDGLIVLAIRLSHALTLHRHSRLPSGCDEQRVRIFWLGYLLDKASCIPHGLGPCQNDEDFDVQLPDKTPMDDVGVVDLPDGHKLPIFHLLCSLSTIRHEIFKSLYSSKSKASFTEEQRVSSILNIESKLLQWKRSLPPPSELLPWNYQDAWFFAQMSLIRINLLYHNTVITLYQAVLFHQAFPDDAVFPELHINSEIRHTWLESCMLSARKTGRILIHFPLKHSPGVRSLVSFALTGFLTLFMGTLDNPLGLQVDADLALMDNLGQFLTDVVNEMAPDKRGVMLPMITICLNCQDIARKASQKCKRP